MKELNVARIGEQFEANVQAFEQMLDQDPKAFKDLKEQFQKELVAYKNNGFLKLAFVGQYSAGKSTIISALTGHRDIKISADIATDKAKNYEWKGIHLIDTPGLFTERKDHDSKTYEALRQSDLLVFCITYSLFDSITIENFLRLAYKENLQLKMMLVVNKFSSEAGNESQRISSYRDSLEKSLAPHPLADFPICYIDALDYIDGINENDAELVEESRFETFINSINAFVEERAALAKLDTPLRILCGYLNEASNKAARADGTDNAYRELLHRLGRVIQRDRERFRVKCTGLSVNYSGKIMDLGSTLVKTADDKNVESELHRINEEAEQRFNELIQETINSIQSEVKEVMNSPLAEAYLGTAAFPLEDANIKIPGHKANVENFTSQFNSLSSILGKVGLKVTKLAGGGRKALSGGQVLFRASNVSGSALHKGILFAGKIAGFKFAPWQAVNFAKTISNFTKFLGPVLCIAQVGMEIYGAKKEAEQEQKASDARLKVSGEFQKIAGNFERQLDENRCKFEIEVFDKVKNEIETNRQKEEEKIGASNAMVKKILELKRSSEALINEIT